MTERWLFLHRRTLDLDLFLHHCVSNNSVPKAQACGLVWETIDSEVTILGITRASQFRQNFHRFLLSQLQQSYETHQLPLLILNKSQTNLQEVLSRLNITHLSYQPLGGWEEHQEEKTLAILAKELDFNLVSLPWNTLIQPEELPFQVVGFPQISSMPRTFTPFRKIIEKKAFTDYQFSQGRNITTNLTLDPLKLPKKLGLERSSDPDTFYTSIPQPKPNQLNLNQFEKGQLILGLESPSGLTRIHQWFDLSQAPSQYKETRNGMGPGNYSSKLSVWLASGTVQASMVGKKVLDYEHQNGANESTYWILFELLWRDFFRFLGKEVGPSMYTPRGFKNKPSPGLENPSIWGYPGKYPTKAKTSAHSAYSGQREWDRFLTWTQGTTGQPLVDGAMKELVHRGTMSNRLRQCVASWLIYDLAVPWWWGALWFEHWLLDYDPDSNWGNWAYLAGVGADPQESRRFNIEKQQLVYDPHGTYLSWVRDQGWTISQDLLPNKIPRAAAPFTPNEAPGVLA